MQNNKIILNLWQNIVWPAVQQQQILADQAFQLFNPLMLADAFWQLIQSQNLQTEIIPWLCQQANESDSALWQHLLGLCAWQASGIPVSLDIKHPTLRQTSLLATNLNCFLESQSQFKDLQTASPKQAQTLLNHAYLFWDQVFRRRSQQPADRAFLFHLLARCQALHAQASPLLKAYLESLWVILLRRVTDEAEAYLILCNELQAIPWQNWPAAEHYQSVLNLLLPFASLQHDRIRSEQFRNDYFREMNSHQAASDLIEQKLSGFLKQNALKLASLQGWVRQLDTSGSHLSYHQIHSDSQSALPIFGWYREQWKNYHHLPQDFLARQKAYEQALRSFWSQVPVDLFQNLNPLALFETTWLSAGDVLIMALIGRLWQSSDDPKQILEDLGIQAQSLRFIALQDALQRRILPARTYGRQQDWPAHTGVLSLMTWVLGHDLALAEEPFERFLSHCYDLQQAKLPEIPDGLKPYVTAYLSLSAAELEHLIPVRWALAEVALNTQPDYLWLNFIHPLSYDKAHPDAPRLPGALMSGRFDLSGSPMMPFVAGYYRNYLHAITELARHWVDTAIYQERKLFAHQQAQSSFWAQRHQQLIQVQSQMQAYSQAKSQLDLLWSQIQNSLQPPAYAAYGLGEWRRLLQVFDDQESFEGITGSHNLTSITAEKLTVYLRYLTAGNHLKESFLHRLQASWQHVSQQADPDLSARQYFALLKLILHDGLDAHKPLSLIQVLWALRWIQYQHSCPVYCLRIQPAREQDLSELLSLDRYSHTQFYQELAQLSGFDFKGLNYSLHTPLDPALSLAIPELSGLFCLHLIQLIGQELQHPEQSDYLQFQHLFVLWQDQQGLLLQILCQNTPSPAFKALLQSELPRAAEQAHGMRDCLRRLLQSSGGSLRFAEIQDFSEIQDHIGLCFWSLKSQNQTVLSLQFGTSPLASSLSQKLAAWRSKWLTPASRPAGI